MKFSETSRGKKQDRTSFHDAGSLENLAVLQLVKKFPFIYGAQRSITLFTLDPILSQMDPVHITHSFSKIYFNINLPSTHRPPSVLFL
jgi:hypothetical protein